MPGRLSTTAPLLVPRVPAPGPRPPRAGRPVAGRCWPGSAPAVIRRTTAPPRGAGAGGEHRGPGGLRAGRCPRPGAAQDVLAGREALAALTPQQEQVVRLAARGPSNRDIGERLHLSPRTVGSHPYRSFPELGVAGGRAHAVARRRCRWPWCSSSWAGRWTGRRPGAGAATPSCTWWARCGWVVHRWRCCARPWRCSPAAARGRGPGARGRSRPPRARNPRDPPRPPAAGPG
ncbi:response regulator transcription factor [Kineococcus indalonis]|uniref:response regulator transcription factor n=1 Tax=Kineococcus indalonis TaxID=2696566 RepID=UPI002B1BE1E8|nr:helix-turn-helix transcriptional regulator [Kineococcus indalonis]